MKAYALGLTFAAFTAVNGASAETYPSRPVTLVVPYGAGGSADTLARTLTPKMGEVLGQPVVVENVTGANGVLGINRVVKSQPDGYTVSFGGWPPHITSGAIYTVKYDILTDLVPVARLPQNPYIAIARKDFPAADFKELVEWLRNNPDKATQGTASLGSGQHISGVYFQKVTGTRFTFVPYKAGAVDIVRDLIAGHIDFTFEQAITAIPHIKAGSVKAYAVTSDQRLEVAPDIPTVDEA